MVVIFVEKSFGPKGRRDSKHSPSQTHNSSLVFDRGFVESKTPLIFGRRDFLPVNVMELAFLGVDPQRKSRCILSIVLQIFVGSL